jgi:pimeloyl-ACP methyl ester carboxylesterase
MNPSMLPQTGPSEVRHPDEVVAVTKRILRRSPARGRHILERLEGVRAIAVDRPGFGLSDPAGVPRERFRTGAVEFLDEVLDELELETAVLAGNSMGGTWALWYALARPELGEVDLRHHRVIAVISPIGFRPSLRVRPDELRQLTVPTLLLWGDHDPVGAVKVAQATAKLIPNAHLEVLPAGHGPWLGNSDRTAELVSRFVR